MLRIDLNAFPLKPQKFLLTVAKELYKEPKTPLFPSQGPVIPNPLPGNPSNEVTRSRTRERLPRAKNPKSPPPLATPTPPPSATDQEEGS